MKGQVMNISGPSGAGKDTVIDAWKAIDPSVCRVVAYTTREPREGEVNGIDYNFVSLDTFREMISAMKFLEYKEVHGQFYGTPIDDLNQMVEEGKTAILKIDVQGAIEAMAKLPDAISIFIMPPSLEVLEQRLRARKTESEEKLQLRLSNARNEIALADKYTHRLVNDEVHKVVEQLVALKGDL
mgnify:CR=1 FL=1